MRIAIVMFAACVAIFLGCSDKPTSCLSGKMVYYTSFERAADTARWEGIKPELFVDDPAPDCGHRSLKIWGGCIQPTASLALGPFDKAAYYSFSVWAKAIEETQTGSVSLFTEGDENPTTVTVKELRWHFLNSDKLVFCPAGKPLRIDLSVGGFVPGSMQIDGLLVCRHDGI